MPRANWKGFLKVGEVTCAVALYTAASTSERISLRTINRASGHRVRRLFADAVTGDPVERHEQVKGYQTGPEDYIMLEPEEVAAAVPEADKTLSVGAFLACGDIDDVYLDKPYYLAPTDRAAEEAFALIREGMRATKTAALAQTVLFRRVRTLLIRPAGEGLIATTLNFDYEVRSAEEAFADVPDIKIAGEMLQLAEHIIATKAGRFDPSAFDDRYESALADLVKAKLEGRALPKAKPARSEKVVDLIAALRESARLAGGGKEGAKAPAKSAGTGKAKAAGKAVSKTASKSAPKSATKTAAKPAPRRKAS